MWSYVCVLVEAFHEPIELQDGTTLRTLRDAVRYLIKTVPASRALLISTRFFGSSSPGIVRGFFAPVELTVLAEIGQARRDDRSSSARSPAQARQRQIDVSSLHLLWQRERVSH